MTERRSVLALAAAACLPLPMPPPPSAPTAASSPSLFEFRHYVLKPSQRDVLIEMFERHFLDAYESGGTRVVATFRNLDDPNRWAWIRAFTHASKRGEALNNFYQSATWRALRDEANATIVDVSDARLLRPVSGSATTLPNAAKAKNSTPPLILVTVYPLAPCGEGAFAAWFEASVAPALRTLGAEPFASFATDRSPNSFPRQPIRDNETVFVTLTRFDRVEAHKRFLAAQRKSGEWATLQQHIAERLADPIETLRLQPTPRSGIQ